MRESKLPSFFPYITLFYTIFLFLSMALSSPLGEWMISFLPYALLGNICIALLLLFPLGKRKKNHTRVPFLPLILLSLVSVALAARFVSFSFVSLPQSKHLSPTINVAFFNKHYLNKNWQAMSHAIEADNPDIIGFAEITKDDITNIKALQNYQYHHIQDNYYDTYLGIFSKYPITHQKLPQPVTHTMSVETIVANIPHRIVVLHVTAPISPYHLTERNQQLTNIKNYLQTTEKENIIIMGDFNLSPWSPMYHTFTQALPHLQNTARGNGPTFTWGIGPIRTHIDHIFVSQNLSISSFEVLGNYGSDHNMIKAKIKL